MAGKNHSGRPWTIRQFSGFGTATDTNQRFKYILAQGQPGLSVAFDVPTLMGYDSDHSLSEGEVGVCGVAVDSIEDMKQLFEGISLNTISTSMTINALADVIFAMYLVPAEKQGIAWDSLRGTIQNDTLKEYIAQKEWICPLREQYGATNERSWILRFHTQTAGCSLTAQQPENNIVRTTIEALAGVLGGTQSLHTNALDEAYALPSEQAAKIAVRTQQIIAHETGITNTVDPLGGPYYIESLTDRLESGAEAYFEQIHAYGGMVEAIEAGYPQREIMTAEARYQEALENGQKIIVGVNDYVDPNEPDIETLHIDPRIETRQKIRLQSIRSRRNSREVIRTLDHLKKTIQAGRNIMPPLLEAVKAYATLEGRSWLYYRKCTFYMMNQRYFS